MLEKHRNADGTYNGVTAMAELSGLSAEEIRWAFDRLKHLMQVDGMTKDAAKAVVKAEVVGRPWLNA